MVLDAEDETGSGNFDRFVDRFPDKLRGDLALTLDGPRHPSGVPSVYFGVRGGAGLTVTTMVRSWNCTAATTATGRPIRRGVGFSKEESEHLLVRASRDPASCQRPAPRANRPVQRGAPAADQSARSIHLRLTNTTIAVDIFGGLHSPAGRSPWWPRSTRTVECKVSSVPLVFTLISRGRQSP